MTIREVIQRAIQQIELNYKAIDSVIEAHLLAAIANLEVSRCHLRLASLAASKDGAK
jgi:hypothetical protein